MVVGAVAAMALATGCTNSKTPSSSRSTPPAVPFAAPGTAGPEHGASVTNTANPIPTGPAAQTQAEDQDLAQAQADITDLENALAQVDSGLNSDPSTEGDVNP